MKSLFDVDTFVNCLPNGKQMGPASITWVLIQSWNNITQECQIGFGVSNQTL